MMASEATPGGAASVGHRLAAIDIVPAPFGRHEMRLVDDARRAAIVRYKTRQYS